MKFPRPLFLPLVLCGLAQPVNAAPIPITGSTTYTQNFSVLGTTSSAWVNDSTVPGWYAQINNGATATGALQPSNGVTGSLNGLLNLGAPGNSDRALGSKATSTGNLANIAYAVQFRNLSDFRMLVTRISYTGELWRTNSTTGGIPETWTVFAARSATPITDIASGASSTTAEAGAGFALLESPSFWLSPNNVPPDTALDGNSVANRSSIGFTPSYLYVDPGEYLVIKWTDTNRAGTDGQQGLDDVEIEFTSTEGAPGLLDTDYKPNIQGFAGRVVSLSHQPDGKTVVGGFFSKFGTTTRNYIARLNANGTLDSFNPNASTEVYTSALLPDGKVMIGGGFREVGGTVRQAIARLNANGTLDTSFNAGLGDGLFTFINVLSNGTFLAGGSGLNVVRFGTGGTQQSFVSNMSGPAYNVVEQPDGKVVMTGSFEAVQSQSVKFVARVSSTGALDQSFQVDAKGAANAIAMQHDGKLLIGGKVGDHSMARLNPDGTTDPAFEADVDDVILTMVLQADGKVIIGGRFRTVNEVPRNRIARLFPDGTLDMAFNPSADNEVVSLALQADGKILVGGEFQTMSGAAQPWLVRLHNDPATQKLSVTAADRVEWLRGGSSPEITQVKIELSTNGGGSWTPLGPVIPIEGGWEVTGTTLPANGLLRARGRTASGIRGGSSGMVETTIPFTATPIALWRFAHFGVYGSTGDAADNADPDHDGLVNLIEFAFGGDPNTSNPDILPSWQQAGGNLILTFTRPGEAGGVTYTAEYNTTLNPAGWTAIPNTGTAPQFTFQAPAGNGRLYLRVRVSPQ